MTEPHRLPIHRRLMLIGLATSGLAVMILSVAFGVSEWMDYRGQALSTLSVQGGVIADTMAPALVFADEKAADEAMRRLDADPTLVHAELRDRAGAIVAQFQRAGRYLAPPAPPPPEGHLFFEDRLAVAKSVTHLGEPVGTLTLQSDLGPAFLRLLKKLLLIAVAMAASLAPALLLFVRFQKPISDQLVQMQLADTVFNASSNAITITDADNRIVAVNAAFCRITGYAENEAIGQTPALLKSGRHDGSFYRAMWRTLLATGRWEGEIWNRRKNGELYAEWLTINAVKNERGEISHHVAIFSDITQRKAAEDEIRHLAFYDPLTRLPNRRLLLDRLQHSLATSARNGQQGALLFIDLDNFKTLNDTLGHDIGDRLLRRVADRLIECVRKGDSVARLGGDEFVVMLENLSATSDEAAAQAEAVGNKILASLNHPYDLGGHEYHGTPSIGIALFGEQRRSLDELLRHADLAMYQAKSAGRNALRFFDPAMQAAISARSRMEAELRQALHEHQFLLVYQPQMDDAGRLRSAEALIRWRHPERGLVPPDQFIPVAEETGLIVPIGEWVLDEACRQMCAWRKAGLPPFTVAVNLSARQFAQERLAGRIMEIMASTCAEPAAVELEITESILMSRAGGAAAVLHELHEKGFHIAIDDFGTGYSSLGYLKRFPVDKLKIDRSFVMDITDDANDAAIASAIIKMGNSLGLQVIAEGVETPAQLEFLQAQGCGLFQGYLFSRPLAAADFEAFVRAGQACYQAGVCN